MNRTDTGLVLDAPRHIAIVGGGVVGVATALALSAKGHLVTIFERGEIGAGTSSGNAGGIVTGAVTPTATPGVIKAIPSYIFNRNGAAVLRPSYFFPILPWLIRFIAAGRLSRVHTIAQSLYPLVSNAMHAHSALSELAYCQNAIQKVGWLKVYGTDAGFAKTALERDLMTRHEVNFKVLNAKQIAELEPKMNPQHFKHGIFQPESGYVNFPKGLTQAYFKEAQNRQTQHIQENVQQVFIHTDGKVAIRTDSQTRFFDDVVIAAGAWSKQLAKQIGDDVSLDTERGYHLSFTTNGEKLLNRPVSFPEKDCVLSPMHDGITLISGDELAGLKAPPDYRRIHTLTPFAKSVLPPLESQKIQREWMGYRPSTPDSVPVIGRSDVCKNVYYAFGHGHLGLTLSAITGQLISKMISGEPAPFDMQAYRINRF